MSSSLTGLALAATLAWTAAGPAANSQWLLRPAQVRDLLTTVAKEPDPERRARRADGLGERLSVAGRLPTGDSSVLFLFQGSARRVSVAGDFNSWNPNADTLSPVRGTPFFFLEKRFDPAARFEYKVVADGVWMLDPFNTWTAMGGFGPNSEVRMPAYVAPKEILPRPGVPRGTLDTLRVASRILRRTHPVHVYIPAGSAPPRESRPLPVIFVMDGGEYLSLASMATVLDNLIFAGRIPPLAAVFIDPRTDPGNPSSTTRMTDYGINPVFVSALVSDFRAPLVQRYGLSTLPSETGILGASLGGLVATYAALSRPDVFGLCAAQSPAYQWQKGAILDLARTLPRAAIRMYIDSGTMRDALDQAQRMTDVLAARGYAVRFQTSPEGHNWGNWRAKIDDLLEFLFASPPLDRLGIPAGPTSREFSFTNKQTAFYYGLTGAPRRTSWMGFHVAGRKRFDDYAINVDGRPLDRSTAAATVFPDRLVRRYPGGITEEFSLADSLPLCWVTVRTPGPASVTFSVIRSTGASAGNFEFSTLTDSATLHTAVFAAGNDPDESVALTRVSVSRLGEFAAARRRRMEQLIERTAVTSSDPRFDAALAWSVLSLDALIMNQGKKGIFAGLPWFTNYWGRDSFISLPGAVLVTGRFREAREILLSFSSFQQLDTSSSDYGRIPNIVDPGNVAYNTADGTPRFVMTAWEYVDRSGDTGFVPAIYPTIVRSIEGTLRYHTDSLGFLCHGDAETWMDAAGPQGPWSPRGNRANDVQALWALQLEAGIRFADAMGDTARRITWSAALRQLEINVPRVFIVDGRIADHLNADGTPDRQERPNVLFTRRLVPDSVFEAAVRHVVTRLTYRHGVASLSQTDQNFHPYHEYPPFYPKDAAYHNGTVWTWLQGPLISELCRLGREDTAWALTQDAIHQILDRGAAGSQSELLDAVARPGEHEPRLSGTFSQAWNLAEFGRNFFEDYLGVQVSLLQKTLQIRPHLPPSLTGVSATIALEESSVGLDIRREGDTTRIRLDARKCPTRFTATVGLNGVDQTFSLSGGKVTTCEFARGDVVVRCEGASITVATHHPEPPRRIDGALSFAVPAIAPGLRALKGPPYPLIDHATIKRNNGRARSLVDSSDPTGDDTGVESLTGKTLNYTYPLSHHFVRGSLDITRFTARIDASYLYCTLRCARLSDPGWHPEYGFQLTFCAIAVDTSPGGSVEIGHNSGYRLDAAAGFERLILLGGGVQVENAGGKILGVYVPMQEDADDPIGDVRTGTVSFALPLKLLGRIDGRTRFTILAGAQDDHGGAGIGEFRTVTEKAGEWNGGGRQGGSNVYDRLDAGTRKP